MPQLKMHTKTAKIEAKCTDTAVSVLAKRDNKVQQMKGPFQKNRIIITKKKIKAEQLQVNK
jgi:hypothetical protein